MQSSYESKISSSPISNTIHHALADSQSPTPRSSTPEPMNSDGIQGFLAESQSTTPRASSPHYAEDNPSVLPKDGGKGEQRISQQVIRVILVTHGDTIADDWHAVEDPVQQDWRLNDKGVAQAYQLMDCLRDTEISAVFSSSHKRALDTARIILEGRSDFPPLHVDSRLNDTDYPISEEGSNLSATVSPINTFACGTMYSNNVTNMDLNENSVKASIERMLSFWQQLFSSQHPTMCRPRIDIELTVPMGQSVQDEHERHEEDINVTRLLLEKEKGKGKGKGKGKATTAISSPRCKGDNTGSDLVNNESPTILPETVISTGRHIPVPRMTLLVIGHSIPFQLLLKSLTIHQIEKNGGNFNNGINQELLKWRNEKDTLLKAQEMDFEMPNGTFTEILMTGHRRFDASMGIVTAGINTDNKENMPSKQWQWQGIVGRFGECSYLPPSST